MDEPSAQDRLEDLEDRLDDLEEQMHRHLLVIERLATEFHGLLMVLTEKKFATLAEIRAKERRLDLASEVKRAQDIAEALRDIEVIDAELDDKDRP